jgi:hypothetical protein
MEFANLLESARFTPLYQQIDDLAAYLVSYDGW